jgi:hypothetical protein
VNKIRSRKRPEFPNETLTPSWDILQAIRTNFHLHPDLSLFHVRGHQDKSTDPSELPFQSQLNIQADALATSFQGTSNHATAKGPLIPGTGCHLVIERQYLPSHHRRKLRTRRGHHQLLQNIQHKHQLSDVAMTHINWESHAQAIQNFQVTSTTFLVKFLSKWLPVGKRVHRYNPAVYPSQCPSCSCENEDFNHAFRCPDPQRRKRRSDLRRELLQRLNHLNTDPVLADLPIDGLHRWLLDTHQHHGSHNTPP